jgi:hypothetical protein
MISAGLMRAPAMAKMSVSPLSAAAPASFPRRPKQLFREYGRAIAAADEPSGRVAACRKGRAALELFQTS